MSKGEKMMNKLVFFLRHQNIKKVYKLAIILFIFSLIFFQTVRVDGNVANEERFQVIPDEAIRLRILANSDKEEDQQIKRHVRDEVNEQISSWVENIADIDEARQLIESRLPEITETTEEVVATYGKQHVQVEYDEQVEFPVKLYDTYLYPAGEYEAILITIGEGEGANWWCVLFPPLCFLDFSNGALTADADEEEEAQDHDTDEEPVKIKFFLFEWFGWT